eukprot:gnl/MRDRNA2_/MRDRNA2_75738_c0_seq1.p1 gnl/MRDRNA2_/MRDRNA2_75738_c0~~gnl/MRDRNA2_/MRDRNA2_75738_c0_seq1.p1  ORF type:complete len:2073 (+),score=350.92 gnl/MRDRNA2_/MRDRNA2_75738_c0_seq1:285-6221(+)
MQSPRTEPNSSTMSQGSSASSSCTIGNAGRPPVPELGMHSDLSNPKTSTAKVLASARSEIIEDNVVWWKAVPKAGAKENNAGPESRDSGGASSASTETAARPRSAGAVSAVQKLVRPPGEGQSATRQTDQQKRRTSTRSPGTAAGRSRAPSGCANTGVGTSHKAAWTTEVKSADVTSAADLAMQSGGSSSSDAKALHHRGRSSAVDAAAPATTPSSATVPSSMQRPKSASSLSHSSSRQDNLPGGEGASIEVPAHWRNCPPAKATLRGSAQARDEAPVKHQKSKTGPTTHSRPAETGHSRAADMRRDGSNLPNESCEVPREQPTRDIAPSDIKTDGQRNVKSNQLQEQPSACASSGAPSAAKNASLNPYRTLATATQQWSPRLEAQKRGEGSQPAQGTARKKRPDDSLQHTQRASMRDSATARAANRESTEPEKVASHAASPALATSPQKPTSIGPSVRSESRPRDATRQVKKRDKMSNMEAALLSKHGTKMETMMAFLRQNGLDESKKVFVLEGPDDHIKQALFRRATPWVENRAPNSTLWDLKWCTTDCDEDYKRLEETDLYNHFQNNRELTTKAGLARNLRNFSIEEHVDIEAFCPRTYDMSKECEREDFVLDYRRSAALNVLLQHSRLSKARQQKRGAAQYACNVDCLRLAAQALRQWTDDLDTSYIEEEGQKCNGRYHISEDQWDALVVYSGLTDAQLCQEEDGSQAPRRDRNRGYTTSGTVIETHEGSPVKKTVQRSLEIRDWEEFRTHAWCAEPPEKVNTLMEELLEILAGKWSQWGIQGAMNAWIVKPGTNSKGSGIQCMNDLPEILHHCKTLTNRIVQKYIERPLLLFSGRKFDIRQWVLVRSFDPLQVFMFSDCYLRLCNEPFDLGDLANRQRHISNWEVNKHGKNIAEGAVASLSAFKSELFEITGSRDYWEEQLLPAIQKIINDTLMSVKNTIIHRSNCFELYGFDLMIDESLTPWLLEVNLSPACDARTPWISTMLERMSSRLLEVILDGKIEPDGQEPDWLCIHDEVAQGLHHNAVPEIEDADADVTQDLSLLGTSCLTATLSSTQETRIPQVKEMAVVGKPLNLKAERRFEQAWRRQEASKTLQRIGRGFLVRSRIRRQIRTSACLVLQRHWRGALARRLAKCKRQNAAVLEWQSRCRSFVAQAKLRRQRWTTCAIALQKRRRGTLGRRIAVARRRQCAATKMQSLVRSFHIRRRIRATLKLIRWWRRLHARKVQSVLCLQALVRMCKARRRFLFLRDHIAVPARRLSLSITMARLRRQVMLCRVHRAARAIQCTWRGLMGRRTAAARKLQRSSLRLWFENTKQVKAAAASLQCWWRGIQGRRRASDRRAAQMRLQRVVKHLWCRQKMRRELWQRTRQRRAKQIQSVLRGWRARRDVSRALLMLKSIVKIQKVVRGHQARSYVDQRRRFMERRRKWLGTVAATSGSRPSSATKRINVTTVDSSKTTASPARSGNSFPEVLDSLQMEPATGTSHDTAAYSPLNMMPRQCRVDSPESSPTLPLAPRGDAPSWNHVQDEVKDAGIRREAGQLQGETHGLVTRTLEGSSQLPRPVPMCLGPDADAAKSGMSALLSGAEKIKSGGTTPKQQKETQLATSNVVGKLQARINQSRIEMPSDMSDEIQKTQPKERTLAHASASAIDDDEDYSAPWRSIAAEKRAKLAEFKLSMSNLPLQRLRSESPADLVLSAPEKSIAPRTIESVPQQQNSSAAALTGSNSPSTTCPPTTPSSNGTASPEGSPCSASHGSVSNKRVAELASLVLDRSHAAILAAATNNTASNSSDMGKRSYSQPKGFVERKPSQILEEQEKASRQETPKQTIPMRRASRPSSAPGLSAIRQRNPTFGELYRNAGAAASAARGLAMQAAAQSRQHATPQGSGPPVHERGLRDQTAEPSGSNVDEEDLIAFHGSALRAAQQLRKQSSAKSLEPKASMSESGKLIKTGSTRAGSAGLALRPPARPSTSSGARN